MIRETTALGAAYLAGLAAGVWNSMEELKQQWSCDRVFEPQMPEKTRNQKKEGWERAVRGSLGN